MRVGTSGLHLGLPGSRVLHVLLPAHTYPLVQGLARVWLTLRGAQSHLREFPWMLGSARGILPLGSQNSGAISKSIGYYAVLLE